MERAITAPSGEQIETAAGDAVACHDQGAARRSARPVRIPSGMMISMQRAATISESRGRVRWDRFSRLSDRTAEVEDLVEGAGRQKEHDQQIASARVTIKLKVMSLSRAVP
jgi:hypothetical protein